MLILRYISPFEITAPVAKPKSVKKINAKVMPPKTRFDAKNTTVFFASTTGLFVGKAISVAENKTNTLNNTEYIMDNCGKNITVA